MKTAVIYARYSSEKQTDQSIEGQIRECTDYAKRHDILILDSYIDKATTGTNDNRFSFQKMLKDCVKQAWDMILVYKLDRFSRNKYEMAIHRKTLRDNGVKLVSVKENIPDTPEGIILESLLEGMAEYYSAELSQKVKRGLRESRLKGLYTGGGLPFGYKIVDHKPVLDEFNAPIVKRIFDEYVEGIPVTTTIQRLTSEGVRHRGKPLVANTVYNMLKNEKYTGVCYFSGERYDSYYPRIVDDYLFKLAQKKMADNRFGRFPTQEPYLLRNKLICGLCGNKILAEVGKGKSGGVVRYYKCSSKKRKRSCNKATIRKDVIENLVIDTTLNVLDNPETINYIATKIIEFQETQQKDNSKLTYLENQKKETEENIKNIVTAIEKGILTETTKERLVELENQLENISYNLIIEKSNNSIKIKKPDIIKFLKKTLKKTPDSMIRHLIKKIVLFDDKMEIYYNYIERKKRTDDKNHQPFLFHTNKFSSPTLIKSSSYKDGVINLSIELFI